MPTKFEAIRNMNKVNLTEQWKPVSSYEPYAVSNLGRVKNTNSGLVLKPFPQTKGYVQVGLSKNLRNKKFYVHHLVAAAFLGNKPDGYVVNHKNGNKQDNRIANLEYVTPHENTLHAYQILKVKMVKLNQLQVRVIKYLIAQHISNQQIAEIFRVATDTIWKIATGRTFKNI